MIIQNSTDIKTELFYDENGDIKSVDVQYEKQTVNPNGLIQLQKIPTIHSVFDIKGKNGINVVEYNKVDTIVNETDFTVDYQNGILTFHSTQKGKEVQISYTNAIGRLSISADRIFTNVSSQGEIVQTLNDIIEDGRDVLEQLETVGGANKVINEMKGYMDSVKQLSSTIIEGSNTNNDLKRTDKTAKATDSSLKENISSANNKIQEMTQWVNQNGNIVNLNNRVTTAEGKLNTVNTQLEHIPQQISEKVYYNQTDKTAIGNYVSIVLDDGYTKDYTEILPIAIEKNIAISMCMITSKINTPLFLTTSQLLELQNVYGWEIMSHTHNHIDCDVATEEVLDFEFSKSKKTLTDLGLKCNNLVYPKGLYSSTSMSVASRYFRAGLISEEYLATNTLAVNKVPLSMQKIHRVFVDTQTLADLKTRVDLMNNTWIVFYTHTDGMSAEIKQKLIDIIDYVKSKNIPIQTISSVLDKIGNKFEVNKGKGNGSSIKVGADGKLYADNVSSEYLGQYTGIKNDTQLSFFPKNKISVTSLTSVDSSGIPYANGIGTLITYRLHEEDAVAFQEFHPMDNSCIAKRNWNKSLNSWNSWVTYKPFTGEFRKTIYPDFGTITGNTNVTLDVDAVGIVASGTLIATPQTALPPAIIIQVFLSTADKVKIIASNISSVPLSVGVRAINLLQR